jgi:tRNA(Ile)-lysidine synthase
MDESGYGDMRACVVAVSGGPDSMALASMLARYAQEHNNDLAIHALTVDHGLRPESGKEARITGQWMAGWPHTQHHILRWEGDKPKTRVMEEARAARRHLLCDYATKNDIKHIFMAHHRDDQAETFLMRLGKGSGLDGLCAMNTVQPAQGCALIRPLLKTPKADLVNYCREMGIPSVRDPSNTNRAYLRPRLRALMDALEKEGISSDSIAHTASRLTRARDALEHYAQQALRHAILENEPGRTVLCRRHLKQCPPDIRLRVIRRTVQDMDCGSGRYGVRLNRLEPLVRDMFEPKPFRKQTLGGAVFNVSSKQERIMIERE